MSDEGNSGGKTPLSSLAWPNVFLVLAGAEIRAIGVVGTDFYDKLLVLRALRKSFPRAWFFTTDLDAGFCHPEEYDHARNLLVASHFGLSLQRKLQGSDLPVTATRLRPEGNRPGPPRFARPTTCVEGAT